MHILVYGSFRGRKLFIVYKLSEKIKGIERKEKYGIKAEAGTNRTKGIY